MTFPASFPVAARVLAGCMLAAGAAAAPEQGKAVTDPAPHFIVVSRATSPSGEAIQARLEVAWGRFRDLFGVEPATVRIVVSSVSGSAQPSSRADQASPGAERIIAWTVTEGEGLDSQGFSDLAHEIAHMYLMDLMRTPPGHHQPHAWLHEAVACYHEGDAFRSERRRWMREHIDERFPLEEFFGMENPVKRNPLVELTVDLHQKLARGEITVTELNQRVSSYAASHAQELAQAGVRNMTYYAQSLSLLEFFLEREGVEFVRSLVRELAQRQSVEGALNKLSPAWGGFPALEAEWVRWIPGREQG